jgi:hypothetical protein
MLFLHLTTLNDTNTLDKSPLEEESNRHRDRRKIVERKKHMLFVGKYPCIIQTTRTETTPLPSMPT